MSSRSALAVCLTLTALAAASHRAGSQGRPDTTSRAPARDTAQRRDTLPVRDTTTARDRVGDLNATAVESGAFTGAVVVPGTRVSLAIGGFVKVLAFHDSDADERAVEFVPADLAPGGSGGTWYGMTAGVSRLFIDARASMTKGDVRGYIEVDFNGPSVLKLRHAYLRHRTARMDLRAGQTWSTFMNASAKPDLLGEAATSGLVELRQTQIRFTRHLSTSLHLSASLENPSSGDVGGDVAEARTPAPDVSVSLAYEHARLTRLQLAVVGRRLQVRLDDDSRPAANAWGAHLSLVAEPADRHIVRLTGLLGDGIGRYLQGLDPSGAATVSPDAEIDTHRAWGGSASYEYPWSATLRSNFVAGTASARAPTYLGPGAFERSDLLAANLLLRTSRYTTVGIEYVYGQRRNVDTASRHNQHIVIGLQVF